MYFQKSRRTLAATLGVLSFLMTLMVALFISCGDDNKAVAPDNSTTGTVTDIDGNVYQTVKIGTQWWMAENLRVTHYRNGDTIPNVTDSATWVNLTTGAWSAYAHDPNNVATYGRLYNWFTVDDSRIIAPLGWHVPTDAEWKQLEMTLGMSQAQADSMNWRGSVEGGMLKDTGIAHWQTPNVGATNEKGFKALPGGMHHMNSHFQSLGIDGYFWSTTESSGTLVWHRSLNYNRSTLYRAINLKNYGFSIRCVKNN